MADRPASIQDLRDRLTGLLADWGAELSLVLRELDEKRARVAELEGLQQGQDQQAADFKRRVDGQQQLIEALKAEAEDAQKLRKVDKDFKIGSRADTIEYLSTHQRDGEIVTGLLYVNEDEPDLHEVSGTTATPLNQVPYDSLCPGADALAALQKRFR